MKIRDHLFLAMFLFLIVFNVVAVARAIITLDALSAALRMCANETKLPPSR